MTTLRLQPGGQGGEGVGTAAVARHEHNRAGQLACRPLSNDGAAPSTRHDHRHDGDKHQRDDNHREDDAWSTTQVGQGIGPRYVEGTPG